MRNFDFTRREYDCLLALRRRPRKWDELLKIAKTDDANLNIMMSRMHSLYYTADEKPTAKGEIKLNQIGETVAQAEYDRRFDMYLTRVSALAALGFSAISLALSIAAMLL